MGLEISLYVDVHCSGKLFRVSERQRAVEGFVGLHGFDAGGVNLVDCFDDGREHAILAVVDQRLESLLILGLPTGQ